MDWSVWITEDVCFCCHFFDILICCQSTTQKSGMITTEIARTEHKHNSCKNSDCTVEMNCKVEHTNRCLGILFYIVKSDSGNITKNDNKTLNKSRKDKRNKETIIPLSYAIPQPWTTMIKFCWKNKPWKMRNNIMCDYKNKPRTQLLQRLQWIVRGGLQSLHVSQYFKTTFPSLNLTVFRLS